MDVLKLFTDIFECLHYFQLCKNIQLQLNTIVDSSVLFRHFDKDKSGKLDHPEFKSCLRSLGYDLPMVEEGQEDPEFQAILDAVDPNR